MGSGAELWLCETGNGRKGNECEVADIREDEEGRNGDVSSCSSPLARAPQQGQCRQNVYRYPIGPHTVGNVHSPVQHVASGKVVKVEVNNVVRPPDHLVTVLDSTLTWSLKI